MILHGSDARARAAENIAAIQAQGAQQQAGAWSGAVQNIGQAVSNIPLQLQQQKRAALQDQIGRVQLQTMQQDLADRQDEFATHLLEKKQQHNDELTSTLGQRVHQLGNTPEALQSALSAAEKAGLMSPDEVQQMIGIASADPSKIPQLSAAMISATKEGRDRLAKTLTVKPGDKIVSEFDPSKTIAEMPPTPPRPVVVGQGAIAVDPNTGKTLATGPAKEPAAKSLQSKSVLLDGKPAEVSYNPADGSFQVAGQPIEPGRVRPVPTQTSVTIQQGASDAKSIADAIENGEQPPTVQGLYRLAGPVRAELAKRGYDMTKANLDWEATKKHLSTLNGAQQTRLRQAISTAADSLGVIEDLATQWDGGKFPLLNKVTLAAAVNGALGPKAQQIATNLQAQITDVTSELGNVYMGGNSPTDHALGLAQKNLAADWTKDQLLSAIKLARTNLQIRQNSITNSGAVLSSPAPSAPAAPAASDRVRVIGPNGQTGTMPSTSALPPGWRKQ